MSSNVLLSAIRTPAGLSLLALLVFGQLSLLAVLVFGRDYGFLGLAGSSNCPPGQRGPAMADDTAQASFLRSGALVSSAVSGILPGATTTTTADDAMEIARALERHRRACVGFPSPLPCLFVCLFTGPVAPPP